MTYTRKIINAETGEETIVPFSEAETIARNKENAEYKKQLEIETAIETQKLADKTAVLAKLGLTQAEANLLLS